MRSRTLAAVVLLLCLGATTGCVLSTQDGEAGHVNSRQPDEIAFHFDSGFNRGVVYGRSVALVLLGLWVIRFGRTGQGKMAFALLGTLPLTGVAFWLWQQGASTVSDYRIEVTLDVLVVSIPPEPEHVIEWESIEGMYIEGVEYRVDTGIDTVAEYHYMDLHLDDGTTLPVDLKRLSVEQRGTLWRAIAKRAHLRQLPG